MLVEPGPGSSGAGRRPAEADGCGAAVGRSGGSVMATARTTYQDGRGADGAAPAGDTFVWVSLGDPSPEELASVQHEFALPGPLVDDPDTSVNRPALEVAGEEAGRLGKVQLVLGDGFVVSVDRDERAVERVSQDLRGDAELAGAGPAAVLTGVLDHAVEGYGPVLSALNVAVGEAAQAVFSAGRSRPTERLYHLARQVLEFRRAAAPLAEMLDRLATESPALTGDRFRRHLRQQGAHLQHLVD